MITTRAIVFISSSCIVNSNYHSKTQYEIVKLRNSIAKEAKPQFESAELFEAVADQHGRFAIEGKVQELSNIC